jgi:hypothetical protein
MISAQHRQKFFDVMIPLGRARVVKVMPSEAACPFCGRHTWFTYSLMGEVLRPASGSGALVDSLVAEKAPWKDGIQLDECTGCRAVCSI